MFHVDSFDSVSLIGLALSARRVASCIMRDSVDIRPIETPACWWAGSVHPDRGYVLTCRGRIVAEVVEFGGRQWADWIASYDPEGAEAFRSALVSEADAAHTIARAVRSVEEAGGFVDGAGENVAGRAPGAEPVAWLDYEEDGCRGRIYFHGAAEVDACLRWARAHDLA